MHIQATMSRLRSWETVFMEIMQVKAGYGSWKQPGMHSKKAGIPLAGAGRPPDVSVEQRAFAFKVAFVILHLDTW